MIEKLEGHKVTHNKTNNNFRIHNGSNNQSTTTEPSHKNGQQPKRPWDLNAFYWYQVFALDSAVVEAKNVELAGRLPNYCNVSS